VLNSDRLVPALPSISEVANVLDPLTILSVAIGIGAAVVALRAWSWRRAPKDSAFGSISERWLAEQRLNRPESER
jgi:hypothetical protein